MDNFKTIIIGFLIVIILLQIWNLLSLKRIKKENGNLDKQYSEIKYHWQMVVLLGTGLVSLFTFMGFNSYESINQRIVSKLNIIDDKLSTETEAISSKLKSQKDSLIIIDSITGYIKENMVTYSKKIDDLQKVMSNIDKIYIVRNLTYNRDKGLQTYKFSDYKTVNGYELPKFNRLPCVIIIPNSAPYLKDNTDLENNSMSISDLNIVNINNNTFSLESSSQYNTPKSKLINFDIYIFYR